MNDNSIRVLQVIGSMNRGGAESMIMNIYRNIDRTKVQFDFVVHTDEKGLFDDEIKSLGGYIYHCPRFNGKNFLYYKKWWKSFFHKYGDRYKVVHGHIGSTASIYLREANKAGLITIAHSHNTKGTLNLKNIMYRAISYNTRYIAQYCFACSQAAGVDRFGKKVTKNDKRYRVINNAIDVNQYKYNLDTRNKIRKEFNIDEGTFVIGHVGRFQTQKNHEFLIDIFKDYTLKNSDTVLVLVGDGELKAEVEKKVIDLGIDSKVIFTGIRDDVHGLLQAFDLFLFPSFYEGLPVTLVEAQCAGLPCVISDAITDECILTDHVDMVSLKESSEEWANILGEYEHFLREDTSKQIIEHGYDIKTNAKLLQEFYLNECEK